MAAATVLALGLAIWCGQRSASALVITSVVLLAVSLLNSWSADHIFRA